MKKITWSTCSVRIIAAIIFLWNFGSSWAGECTSMLPYLRDIKTSASAASHNAQAGQMYRSMLQEMKSETDAAGGGAGGGYGLWKADANYAQNRSNLEYHLASADSNSASAHASSQWLQNYANTLSSGAATMLSDCLKQRGIEYKFFIGADGDTFYIKATFTKPTDKIDEVTVKQVEHGKNVSCKSDSFKTIDSGESILKCTRLNLKPDSILIATDYYSDLATYFEIPDARPRYTSKTKSLSLTFCGSPGCAADMTRQFAWSPASHQALSCNVFDLKALGLLRDGDILDRDQTFPLQLTKTIRGDWGDIHQDIAQSVPLASTVIKLCGTRAEPFEAWPNLYFETKIDIRYFEKIL